MENLVGEAKREGLDAIPSAKFKTNYAFFQIVMLVYQFRCYLKMIAEPIIGDNQCVQAYDGAADLQGIENNTIRIACLMLLFIAVKVVKDSNVDKVKYSINDARTPAMMNFIKFIDKIGLKTRPWEEDSS